MKDCEKTCEVLKSKMESAQKLEADVKSISMVEETYYKAWKESEAKIAEARKLVENIHDRIKDEWCKTDDCPECVDCTLFEDIERLSEVFKGE